MHSDPLLDPWNAAMARGDFAAAWQISDAVLEQRRREGVDCTRWPRHQQFIWRGQSFLGRRVLVRCYHGLGDTLQFVRLLPLLRQRARHVTLWVQPVLLELLRGIAGADRLLALHDGAPPADYDVDVELMELPHALRLLPTQIPRCPYLRVAAQRCRRTADLRHVGISWVSGSWSSQRTLASRLLDPLRSVPHVRWHSLQFGVTQPPLAATVLDRQDLLSLAQQMCKLDLVISVDTMTAHWAGALDVPTWTLLPTPCDWRWQGSGEHTPWYASMRLFRQPEPGAWPEVIEAVRQALSAQQLMPLR